MSVTGGIIAGAGIAGSLGGAALSSSAASNAADTQTQAAEQGQQLQAQEAQNALDFQKQEWQTNQTNEAPWLQAGQGGLNRLQTLLGLGTSTSSTSDPAFGSLAQPFTPPTAAQAEQYPGYEFGQQQGQEALNNSAAAKGNLLSGNTQEALNKFGQDYAQNDYSNVYNQSFNTFQANQANTFNRLAALSGIGQQSATTLGQQGQQAANNVGNISLTTGAQQGQELNNAGAATASGYVGSANAWAGGLGGSTNSLQNLLLLSQLGQGGGGGITPGSMSGLLDYNNG